MDTNFWLATLLTESGGLQLEVILVDTLSEVPPLSSGTSLKIGWGGLSAHGDGMLDVDLSRFFYQGGYQVKGILCCIQGLPARVGVHQF